MDKLEFTPLEFETWSEANSTYDNNLIRIYSVGV